MKIHTVRPGTKEIKVIELQVGANTQGLRAIRVELTKEEWLKIEADDELPRWFRGLEHMRPPGEMLEIYLACEVSR